MKRFIFLLLGWVLACPLVFAQRADDSDAIKLPQMQPKKWAICIGVTDYKTLGKLTYAVKDCLTFADTLKSDLGFSPDSVFVMADKEGYETPTADNVKKRLDEILAKPELDAGNLFIIYFSGHGIGLKDGDYWMPNDVTIESASEKGIPVADIIAKLAKKNLRNVVIISDACRAGQENTFGKNLIEQSKKTNIGVLLGCAPGQKSYEAPKLGQGTFTYFLSRAIKGKSALDSTSGALLLSKVGTSVAKSVEEYTRHDYGDNAQKPSIFAEKEQEVVLTTKIPAVSEVTEFLKNFKQAFSIGEFTQAQYNDALTTLAHYLHLEKRDDDALAVLRTLQSFGNLQSAALYTYVLICKDRGASYELNSALQKNSSDDPDSLFDDLAMVHAGFASVGKERFFKAIWNLYNSDSKRSLVPVIGALIRQAGNDLKQRQTFSDRLHQDFPNDPLLASYADLVEIGIKGDTTRLENAFKKMTDLDKEKEFLDAGLRIVFGTYLDANDFVMAGKTVEKARESFPGTGFWEMRSLVIAALTRDPKLLDRVKDVLAKTKDGTGLLSTITLLRSQALTLEAEYKSAAERLPNSLEAQIAYWQIYSVNHIASFKPVPEELQKLAKGHLRAANLAYRELNDLLDLSLNGGAITAQQASSARLKMANDICEEFAEIGDDPDLVVLLAKLLNRSSQSYRVAMLGLYGPWYEIENRLITNKADYLKELYFSLINNGMNSAAPDVWQKLEKSGGVDVEALIHASIDAIFDNDYPKATKLVDRLLALNPAGARAWHAKAIAAYLAFEKGDNTAITKLTEGFKANPSVDFDGVFFYEFVLYITSEKALPSPLFTKFIAAPQPLFHDVWSVAMVNVLERCRKDSSPDGKALIDLIPEWMASEGLNGNFMRSGYNAKPDTSLYKGHYEFTGYFALKNESFDGAFVFDVDEKGNLKGKLVIVGEKDEVIPISGTVNGFGRGSLNANFGGKENTGMFALIPYAKYASIKKGGQVTLEFILNTTSPFRMGFIITNKKDK